MSRGNHSAGQRGFGRGSLVLLGVLGVCLAVIVALIVVVLTRSPGSKPAASSQLARPSSHPAPSATATQPASPTTRPSSTAPPRHADPLTGRAVSYLASRGGTVLAAVQDLRTGQTWTLGGARPQAEASVVKLDVLETLLAQHGGVLPAADQSLAQLMIEDSDNGAATSLWNADGAAAGLRAYNSRAGLAHTTPSACLECPGFPWPGWGLTTTLPSDQITLLRDLVQPGPVLGSAARGYALRLMENVTESQRWGVSGGVPAGVTVALKNGWLPLNGAQTDWQINSVGWISGQGCDYLMAVLSTGNPSEQYGIDTTSQLAAYVWEAMAGSAP